MHVFYYDATKHEVRNKQVFVRQNFSDFIKANNINYTTGMSKHHF